jgi:hypothetical protein
VLTSTSAEKAARSIVGSTRRGEGKVVLTWQAKLLRLAHGLAPNAVLRVLSWVNQRLPGERGLRFESRQGRDLSPEAPSFLRRRLSVPASKFNEQGAETGAR